MSAINGDVDLFSLLDEQRFALLCSISISDGEGLAVLKSEMEKDARMQDDLGLQMEALLKEQNLLKRARRKYQSLSIFVK